jgi:hypothetical protein
VPDVASDHYCGISTGGMALGGLSMSAKPTIARVWRGRTSRDIADAYEQYLLKEGIPPLRRTALGVQLFREDREAYSEFVTTSYWPSEEAMSAFTGGDPHKVHHLDRDPEFLLELPERIAVQRILVNEVGEDWFEA